MFTPKDIERAHRLVKTATAGTPPVGTKLDPYAYNSEAMWDPKVNAPGWNPNPQPGFWGSLGKSVGGTLLRTPGVDMARSAVGLSPGRSGIRNWLGGSPKAFGGQLFNRISAPLTPGGGHTFDPWVNEGRAQNATNVPGINFAAPWMRADEQSKQLQSALPQYLEKHAPVFVHPWQTLARWGSNTFGSKYPYP